MTGKKSQKQKITNTKQKIISFFNKLLQTQLYFFTKKQSSVIT